MWVDGTQPGNPDESGSEEATDSGAIGVGVTCLARLAGVHRPTIYQWMRTPGFPSRLEDGSMNPFLVGAWHRQRQLSKAALAAAGGDPLLAAHGDSEALEAYRWQRAMLAGYDVEERRRIMVRADDLRDTFGLVSQHLRTANRRIAELFGPDAGEVLRDALDEATQFFVAHFGTPHDTGIGGNEASPEIDDP